MWLKRDEWTSIAPCGNDPRFGTAPWWDGNDDEQKLGPEGVEYVAKVCAGCPVRPECIEAACVDRQENSVWVAGEWLTDTYTAANRRELEAKRQELIGSLPHEYLSRPDEVL